MNQSAGPPFANFCPAQLRQQSSRPPNQGRIVSGRPGADVCFFVGLVSRFWPCLLVLVFFCGPQDVQGLLRVLEARHDSRAAACDVQDCWLHVYCKSGVVDDGHGYSWHS